jgi:hypothetical protein
MRGNQAETLQNDAQRAMPGLLRPNMCEVQKARDPAFEAGEPVLGRETPLAQSVDEACRVALWLLQRPFTSGVARPGHQFWLSVPRESGEADGLPAVGMPKKS